MEAFIASYISNFNVTFLVVIGALVLFFLRKPLKALLAIFVGYRANIDDYAIAIHSNREAIFKNETLRLKSNMGFKNYLAVFIAVASSLVSPLLFAVLYLQYRYRITKKIFTNFIDIKVYNLKDEDPFLKFMNEKSEKINFLVSELWMIVYLFMAVGIFFHNSVLLIVSIAISSVLLFASLIAIYNTYMYQINYKTVDYFRGFRLLNASALANMSPVFVLALLNIISYLSNYTFSSAGKWVNLGTDDLSWFHSLVTILAILKFINTMAIRSILMRNDAISDQHQKIENREYKRLELVASYPNPISQSRGYKFSTPLQLKFFELAQKVKSKRLVYLDNYAFFPEAVNRTDLRKNPAVKTFLTQCVENVLDAVAFTKQFIIIGGMGSGKTAMIYNIIAQTIKSGFTLFQNITYHDTKGMFVKELYREGDYIINLYDERASVWSFFTEMKYNIEAGTVFIHNVFESLAGKETEFFSGRAKQLAAQWVKDAYFNTNSNIEAWEYFFNKMKEFETELAAKDDKTQQSVLQVMKIVMEILELMKYQICVEKRQILCIHDFIYGTGKQLFLSNNKQFAAILTPYLNGVMAAYAGAMMMKDDNVKGKEHLILNVLDEFLAMKLEKETRDVIMREIRSKGGCNIIAAQYFPQDEELLNLLDSSLYALITFNINGEATRNLVANKFAKAEMLTTTNAPQLKHNSAGGGGGGEHVGSGAAAMAGVFTTLLDGGRRTDNYSYAIGESDVIVPQQLQSMPNFTHLTFIPSETVKSIDERLEAMRFFRLMLFGYEDQMLHIAQENEFLTHQSGLLYLGYTKEADKSIIQDNVLFDAWDMREFYMSKGKEGEAKKQPLPQAVTFDEKTLFTHYLNVKYAGSIQEAKEYMKANKLERLDIDSIFKSVEENAEKVLKLIAKYNERQRHELMEEFFAIPKENFDEKYEFCKKYDLIGGILGIFTFSEDYLASLDDVLPNEDK